MAGAEMVFKTVISMPRQAGNFHFRIHFQHFWAFSAIFGPAGPEMDLLTVIFGPAGPEMDLPSAFPARPGRKWPKMPKNAENGIFIVREYFFLSIECKTFRILKVE